MPAELVLHPRAVAEMRSARVALGIIVMLMLLLGVAVAVLWLAGGDGEPSDGGTIGARLLKGVRANPTRAIEFVLLSSVTAVYAVYFFWSARRERLILSDLGVRYVSPLPAALQFLRPSWSLQWSQVRRIELKANKLAPALTALVLDAGTVKRSLLPHAWIDPARFKPKTWRELTQLRKGGLAALAAEALESPLVRFIQQLPGQKLDMSAAHSASLFALEKSPAALVAIALFFVFAVYAFVDSLIVYPETYVEGPPYGLYVAAALIAFWMAFTLMRRAHVPKPESIGVAVLMAGAFGAAFYPGLLRLNALTDTQGLTAREYRMEQAGVFAPLATGLPMLEFPERHWEYWSQYPSGRQESFQLRKGGLGFFQIDMTPVYERINHWYESGDRRRSPGRK